ncbi:DUF2860 family protein [Paraferrimonas sedimenticola]|uniref:DUF2860 domain-containing protein n=1 Tax=Paraferrimonas sedimenticola TaxID=375674 RepID=A0AA37RT61_9GAMM|nr:DUF2860 family protein [Paraferrimonas sedimenticola]GLP95073.1 hypothetical protein GCM10007895_03790 [Paraferrimonas sedimenticola]
MVQRSLIAFAVLSALVATPALAEKDEKRKPPPLAEEPGWDFTINLNAGVGRSTSQFNPENENAVTKDLNNSGTTTTKGVVFPLLRAAYTQQDLKTQWFLGNSLDNVSRGEFQLEAGVTREFDSGTRATFALFPDLPFFGETWADPYLIDEAREKTDVKNQGGRIALDFIWGLPINLKYGFANTEVKKEISGQSQGITRSQQDLLVRDGNFHRVTLEGFVPLSKNLRLTPSLFYTRGDLKGKAMASKEFGGRFAMNYNRNRHFLTANISYSQTSYDASNPVFMQEQKDKKLGVFALYAYKEPFGWKDFSMNLIVAWSDTRSNIVFYESDVFAGAVGLTYRF